MKGKTVFVLVLIFISGLAIGYSLGSNITFYKVLSAADVTVDFNESKVVPIAFDWMESHGYMDSINKESDASQDEDVGREG